MQETPETLVQSLGRDDSLEEEVVTHSSICAWKIPWTEEPGRLQSMGSQSQTRLSTQKTHTHTVGATSPPPRAPCLACGDSDGNSLLCIF